MKDWIDHERALAGLPSRTGDPRLAREVIAMCAHDALAARSKTVVWIGGVMLSGVTADFTADHRFVPLPGADAEPDIHSHTWKVTAWFKNDCRSDARCMKAALTTMLAQWEGKLLPDSLSWNEDIAWAVGRLANVVMVEVSRDEGFSARWIAEAAA